MRTMQTKHKRSLLALSTVLILVASFLSANLVLAKGQHQQAATPHVSGGGQRASAPMVALHTVDMSTIPAEAAGSALHTPTRALPIPAFNPALYARLKAAALHNPNAPVGINPPFTPPGGVRSNTPVASKSFQGIADSTTVCPYFGGCQPPDQALAASPSWVFEGVNTSFAVYNTAGKLQKGWPKNSQKFFGVPNPGSCDPNGAFMSDPRAFYDPNDGRFWVAMLQVEGAGGLNACPEQTLYWIAVSQTSNPNKAWNVYTFDMHAGINTTDFADYTMFGFDQTAIYFSANMFNQAGTAYDYAEIFGALKSPMENGQAISFFGFVQLFVSSSRSVRVDTVQPVETEASAYSGPNGGVFVNTFNGGNVAQFNGDPFGDDCISTSCHGMAVWTLTNPGTSSTTLSFAFVDTASYILPPGADEPGCAGCIESLDTRISGTPVYHNGLVSFALETALNNGSQNVPGILWGQVVPQINDNGTLAGATLFQQGDFFFVGDLAATFGALMPDATGDLFMVYDFMSSSTNPEIAYTSRRVALPLGSFHDAGFVLRAGDAATTDGRWGDFAATSYDGPTTDNVWFAGEYAPASGPANGDWSTFIGRDKFCVGCN